MADRYYDRDYDRDRYTDRDEERESYSRRYYDESDRYSPRYRESRYSDRDTSAYGLRNSDYGYNPPDYGSARSDYGRYAYGSRLSREGIERGGRYSDYDENRGSRYASSEERGFFDRAADEVRSWFGDEEAERRRRIDARASGGPHRGRGPKGYQRSDERITEDVNERLWQHSYIDASDIEVNVENGEVTLKGTVNTRYEKRLAEDIAETVSGVRDVHNQLRISRGTQSSEQIESSQSKTRAATG